MLRTADLNMSGSVWTYEPEKHKTQHHGRRRVIFLGPKAQEVLRPFLQTKLDDYLFSPVQSEHARRQAMHAARETPLSCGNKPGSNRKRHPKWGPKARYSADTYRKAIDYACRRAFPAPEGTEGEALKSWRRQHSWSPNQLRHSFATKVRREHGLEAAQVLLGHAQAEIRFKRVEHFLGMADGETSTYLDRLDLGIGNLDGHRRVAADLFYDGFQ